MSGTAPLLDVRELSRSFSVRGGALRRVVRVVPAVRSVSFAIEAGRTLALVGESGSGKTTTARLVLRLLRADSGRVVLGGRDWLALTPAELRAARREVGVVFQDPATSLDPRMSVEAIVGEPLAIHGVGSRAERRERVKALLEAVGVPLSALGKRPGEFSGGQRQRIGIARALATAPRFVVLDEPVSALDVSVRAQVLNLLLELQEKSPERPAYLFIGHDLAVVGCLADRTAVMYLGRVVEEGPTAALFASPRHPYTALLLASQPGNGRGLAAVRGEAQAAPAQGCPFAPRCPSVRERCRVEEPPESVEPATDRRHRCFFPGETFPPGLRKDLK